MKKIFLLVVFVLFVLALFSAPITYGQSISTKQGGNNSLTITTETDTIRASAMSATPLTWWSVSITAYDTDLEFDYVATFTKPKRLKAGTNVVTGQLSIAKFPLVFLRRKGSSGTVTYDYESYGN